MTQCICWISEVCNQQAICYPMRQQKLRCCQIRKTEIKKLCYGSLDETNSHVAFTGPGDDVKTLCAWMDPIKLNWTFVQKINHKNMFKNQHLSLNICMHKHKPAHKRMPCHAWNWFADTTLIYSKDIYIPNSLCGPLALLSLINRWKK